MTTLTDKQIRERLYRVGLDPEEPSMRSESKIRIKDMLSLEQIQQCSVDLRLGHNLKTWNIRSSYRGTSRKLGFIDFKNPSEYPEPIDVRLNAKEMGYVLHPGDCVLWETMEHLTLPSDIKAQVMGRSTIGRCFVTVHKTAGLIDPGFSGRITLEVKNQFHQSVRLYVGQRVAQVCFEQLQYSVTRPYGTAGNHYKNSDHVENPVLVLDKACLAYHKKMRETAETLEKNR